MEGGRSGPAACGGSAGSPEVVVIQSGGPGHDTPLPTLYEGDVATAELVSQHLRNLP
jgi:hypothetical protein